MPEMPAIDTSTLFQTLSGEEFAMAMYCLKSTKGIWHLRATKPQITNRATGIAAYAWREAAFYISPNSQHWCMPVTNIFYLQSKYGTPEYKADETTARKIADAITNCVPPQLWHGVRRWGNAMGIIGTPQYNDEGAVIYR